MGPHDLARDRQAEAGAAGPGRAGKSLEQIAKATDRDYYMTAEEAKEFGIVDQVITTREAIEAADGSKDG